MDVVQIVILALVQALTEFLPISSSGHLVLASWLFGWTYQGLAFDVALHVGTLLAVLIYYRRDFTALALETLRWRPGSSLNDGQRLAVALAIGTIPAGLAGLLLGENGALILRHPASIASALILFGLLLGYADRAARAGGDRDLPASLAFATLSWRAALLIGCAQALALIPGVSRSGIVMTAALLLGFSRTGAARYAFLLSVPVMILAGAHGAWELLRSQSAVHWGEFALGAALAAVAGVAVIHLLLSMIRRVSLLPFVVYRLLLGASVIILLIFIK